MSGFLALLVYLVSNCFRRLDCDSNEEKRGTGPNEFWLNLYVAWLFFFSCSHGTMGQNQVVVRHPITHFPISSGGSERESKQMSARAKRMSECTMVENRKKHRLNSNPIIHCPTSEGVSEVSERANEWAQRRARAKRAVRSKPTSERCERTSERTSEWPSTAVCIFGCYRP